MNNCLLLSGLARNVELAYSNIYENILVPNNPDVFIHTWLNDEDDVLKNTIINLYKPKKIEIEKLKSWKNSKLDMTRMMNSYAKPYVRDNFVDTFYSCWYSVNRACVLKDQYRLDNNINYDYSMRARFDINYNCELKFEKYDNSIIHLSNRDLPPEMIDDRFAFGNDSLINIYSSSFNHIDFIHQLKDKKDGIFCGESLVYEICKIFSINYKKIGDLHASHVR